MNISPINSTNKNLNCPSFKGFSNIISEVHQSDDGIKLAFIALQLDNNGKPDLDNFIKLKDDAGIYGDELYDDKLVLTHFAAPHWGEHLVLNSDNVLPNSDKLLAMNALKSPEYAEYKTVTMNIYTFLSDLTSRISKTKFVETVPYDMSYVISYAEDCIAAIGNSAEIGYNIVNHAKLKGDTHIKDAEYFNRTIYKRIAKFFK